MKLLVATDGSKNALRAVQHAVKLLGSVSEPGSITLISFGAARRSKACAIAAAAPSVAKPSPQRGRATSQPTSRPGQPSGRYRPMRPTSCPLAFSSTAQSP